MSNPTVDIAIACSNNQLPAWWNGVFGSLMREAQRGIEIRQLLAISSALPDFNKNNSIGLSILEQQTEGKKRMNRTDANRNEMSNRFISGGSQGKSDWIFMIDDDTIPADGTLSRLLALEKDFVAGLYFNTNPPYNPIAYVRNKTGIGYYALYDYPYGTLFQVDSVGMGCTLIHRSVFERIAEEHEIRVRPNGSLFPVHKSQIYAKEPEGLAGEVKEDFIAGGWSITKVAKPSDDDDRAWPFYSMEYGRTEDHHFCELAANVGIRPWVDTRIICDHMKPQAMTYNKYRESVNERNGLV